MTTNFNLRLTPAHTLKALLILRTIAVITQIAVLTISVWRLELSLPWPTLFGASALLAFSTLALFWRQWRLWPITELEITLHLALDIAVLTWLLYFAGGSNNAFVSAYLVPIALAALTLQLLYSVLITLVCVSAYSLLFMFHVPLLPMQHAHVSDFGLHVFGMWVNFIVSAGLIGGLLWLLAENIRRRDSLILEAREAELRNQHVVALAALAASAAHELSTPLSTIALLADELAHELADQPAFTADLTLLKLQVAQCKTSLATLLNTAQPPDEARSKPLILNTLLQDVLQRWQLLRPEVSLHWQCHYNSQLSILPGSELTQILFNLLNNAADASLAANQAQVALHVRTHSQTLILEVSDQGHGLDAQARLLAGRIIFSNKANGSGLGLLLTHTTLARWGGSLSLHQAPNGGTLARIALPLSTITPS